MTGLMLAGDGPLPSGFTPITMGWLIAVLSVPMALREVEPNGTYGLRTSTTLGDPRVWYAANAWSGKGGIVLGVALFSFGLAVRGVFPAPRWLPRTDGLVTLTSILSLLAWAAASAVYAELLAARLAREDAARAAAVDADGDPAGAPGAPDARVE